MSWQTMVKWNISNYFKRSIGSVCPEATDVPFVTFNNGKKFPMFGLGTWKSNPSEVKEAVHYAIDTGYRHIDCAFVYENEKEIGDVISGKISEKKVKRSDLYITSKLWNTFHEPSLVKDAIKKSLYNLKLDFLDLYLMHFPHGYKAGGELRPKGPDGKILFSDVDYVDTWKAMEKVCREGLTLSIGVSNFTEKQIERILKIAKILPVTNQIECHPYLTQKSLLEFCKSRDIVVTAYSPLGSPDRPRSFTGEPVLLRNKNLKDIGERHNKTPAQILIKYHIQQGRIVTPKSASKSHIVENRNIFDFELHSNELQFLDALNINLRYCPSIEAVGHKYYPFENS